MINCECCKFYKPFYPASDEGECRRYAPPPRRPRFDKETDGQIAEYAAWPIVFGDIDCCGEAVRKGEGKSA